MIIVPVRRTLALAVYLVVGCCTLSACSGQSSATMPSLAYTATPPAPPTAANATVGPGEGEAIFQGRVPIEGFVACQTCHAVAPVAPAGVGPNLAGIATRGAARVPGLTATEYIRRSIRIHDEYVVSGYAPGITRAVVGRDFDEVLSDDQIEQLVAYLMTLVEPPASAAAAGGAALSSEPSATTLPSSTSGAAAPPRPSPTRAKSVTPAASATPAPSATDAPPASATPAPSATSTAPASATPASATAAASATPAPSATDAPPASATPAPSATSVIASDTPVPTSAPPTSTSPPPSATTAPTPAPTPASAPSPAAEATPTAAPTAEALPSAPDDPELARYAPCVTCHDQHPLQVAMPHPLNPTCNECHRGSPNRIGCPSCHSMHTVDNKHDATPDLQCASCHS